jgi:tetracycline resistance efflux pump
VFEETVWSLIPPLTAITLAIVTRQVFLALGLGIVSGAIMLEAAFWPGMARSVELVVDTLNDPSNAMVVLFTFVIGSLISSMESVGGIRGFVNWLEKSGWLKGERSVKVLVWLVGVLIFIESNITILVAGALARPLFDKFKISREKLAYLIDSTSAPICLVIPFNAWGAYIISILQTLGEEKPVSLFVRSIAYNFYSLFAVSLALITALFAFDLGPMKKAEERTKRGQLLSDGAQPMVDETLFAPPDDTVRPSGWLMIAPILTLVIMMPLGLYLTGRSEVKDLATASIMDVVKNGKGAVSVLWSVIAALVLLWIMQAFRSTGKGKSIGTILDELVRFSIKGAQGMLPLALIILMALTLGSVTKLLGTGVFVARVASANMSAAVFLPVIFIVAAFVAFSTGTSWGTFAIMVPVAIPAAGAFGVDSAPFLAAALSGGIFGDHASPISDTTIMASMAAVTDHIDHVRTQLPYAMLAGGGAIVAYFLVGMFLL